MTKSALLSNASSGTPQSLRRIFPWADDKVIQLMREHGQMLDFKIGDAVYLPDQRVTGLYFVKKGVLKICERCGRDDEQIVNLFSSGDLIGLRSMLNMEFYDSSLYALAPTKLITVKRDAFLQAVMSSPQISHSVMKQLENGIAEMEGRLTVLLQRPIKERFANAIITLANKFGCDQNHQLKLALSPKEWASLICTTRTSLYRIMGAMESEGIIQYRKHGLTLTNRKELLELAIPSKTA